MDAGTVRKSPHILILEDDRDQQDLISRAFRDDPESFRVSFAGTVRKAREIIGCDPPPDLLIADWNLPDGKGIEILPRRDGMVTIPLIIMTGYGDEPLAVEIMKSGAIDYVVKSVTVFNDLPQIARRALRDWNNIQQRKQAEQEKLDSEKRLADIISFLPDAVLAIDTEGRVIAWNDALERMTGVADAEMLGKGDYEYSIPFYGERRPILIDLILIKDEKIEKKYLTLQREGERISSEVYIPTLFGGKGAYLWGTASPLYDGAGNRVGAIEIIRDITDRKKAEEMIVSTQQKLTDAQRLAHLGNWDWDMENDTVTWSEELYNLAGRDPSLPAPTYAEHPRIYTSSSWDRLSASVTRSLTTGEPYNLELELIRSDGSIRWVNAFGGAKYDGNKKVIGLYGTLQDINERKQAELALQESQEHYRLLFDSIDEGFCIIEMIFDKNEKPIDYRFLEINPSFERQTGLSDAQGRRMRELAPKHEEHWFEIYGKIALTGQSARFVNCAEQLHRWYDVYAFRFGQPENRQVAVLFNDITKKIKVEGELRKSEDRFRHISGLISDIAYSCERPPGGVFSIDWITEAVERITGLSDNEILAMGCWRGIVIEEDYPIFDEKITGLLPGHSSQNDLRIRTKDGAIRWLTCFTECVSDPARPGYHLLFGGCRDITESKEAEEIRNAYQARLNSAMEIGSLAWWEMDLPDGAVRFDDRKATMLGYFPEQFHHYTDFTALLHPEDYGPAMQAMKDHLEGKEARYHADYRIQASDGNYLWFRDVGGLTSRHPDGTPATITGIVIDITTSKKAEAQIKTTLHQLEHSEALLRKVYDILPIGLWLADKHGDLLYGNPAGVKIWGAEPHVPIEQYGVFKARRYPSGEEIATEDWALAHTILEGVTIKDELLEIDAFDGKKKIILNYTAPLYDINGAIDGAIVVNHEITEKEHAQKALRDNQTRLATAMDIANLVNWEYDVATGMFTFDDRFYALYETTTDREGGNQMSVETYMQEFVFPDDRPAVLAEIQKILTTKDPAYTGEIEHRITPRDGSVRTIIARFAPIMDPDGNVIRAFGTKQDITDRMLMLSEIRSLNIVLEQRVKDRTEALIETNEKLKEENAQRLEAEGKLQASYDEKVMLLKEIHHRVKNNLQIIASLLNLQSRYITDEKTLAAIKESQNRVKAMALVHEKLYRSEDIAHISLRDYIRFLGTGLFQFYDAKIRGIQFKLEISDIDVDIDAAIPLGLIINELISNSLKYGFPEGRTGEVFISVKKEGHTLNVLFHDTGIGIPADLDWREAPSLGLRLVITLVDQMNGTVELNRSDGTTFTMVLHEKESRGEK